MIDKTRSKEFQKNKNLESLLESINEQIQFYSPTKQEAPSGHPTIFIVGAPRSGTTLLTQWLSSTELFCYPSNLISRFYKNPILGGLVQQLLFDAQYHYSEEFNDLEDKYIPFESSIGKTKSVLSPNEFWYFWRRFYDFPEIFDLDKARNHLNDNFDFVKFNQELDGIKSVFDKPIFLKGLIINEFVEQFYSRNNNVFFIWISRDLHDNALSLINTRELFFNDKKKWYSFKNTNYSDLHELHYHDQVVRQVDFINNSLSQSLVDIPEEKVVRLRYEEFCNNPKALYDELVSKLRYIQPANYNGVKMFEKKVYEPSELSDDIKKVIARI